MSHPRYSGPVLDAHCHWDATTVAHAGEAMDRAGLAGMVHFWDIAWPPPRFADEGAAFGERDARLHRCHVPDLSHVGEPGDEQRLAHEVRAAADAGAVGVKLWKNLGLWLRDAAGERIAVDDPRLEPIWRRPPTRACRS